MRLRWAVLVCAPWLLGAGPAPVTYTLTPKIVDGRLDHVAVQLEFAGDPDGLTEVRLPDRFNGETALHRHLTDLTVTGAALSRPEPAKLRLSHKPGAALSLQYRVVNGRGPRAVVDYRPDLGAEGFTVLGETVFAYPSGRLSRGARVTPIAAPPGWTTASDLARATTVEDVLESVVTAGRDVRQVTRATPAGPLTVALRGQFAFTAEAFADRLSRMLAAQRAVHGEPAGPFLAVVQGLPEDPGRFTRDGVGRGDAAAYFISSEESLNLADRIMAHEPVHAWLPRKVGGLPRGAAEPGAYWFSEGFADFVALRSLAHADLWSQGPASLGHYVSGLNARVDVDAVGGEGAIPNSRIVEGYGSRPELRSLPYRRGLALALIWDSRLRAATAGRTGVDDVLRAMRARAAAAGAAGPTADVLFPRIYRELGGPDLSADIAAHVRDGRPIIWPDTLYDGCVRVIAVRSEPILSQAPLSTINRDLELAPGLSETALAACRRQILGG